MQDGLLDRRRGPCRRPRAVVRGFLAAGAFLGFGCVAVRAWPENGNVSTGCMPTSGHGRSAALALFLETPRQFAVTELDIGRPAGGIGQRLPAGEKLGDQRVHFRARWRPPGRRTARDARPAAPVHPAPDRDPSPSADPSRSAPSRSRRNASASAGSIHAGTPSIAEKVAAELHDFEAVAVAGIASRSSSSAAVIGIEFHRHRQQQALGRHPRRRRTASRGARTRRARAPRAGRAAPRPRRSRTAHRRRGPGPRNASRSSPGAPRRDAAEAAGTARPETPDRERRRRRNRGDRAGRQAGNGAAMRDSAGGAAGRSRRCSAGAASPARLSARRRRWTALPEFPQAVQHRPDDERAHLRLVAETHLALRRMHVHVDRRRIEFEEEKRQRIAPLRQRLMVALDQRVAERAAVHRPAVDDR